MNEKVFWTWPINPVNQLRISAQRWRGRWAVDIRRYWIKPDAAEFSETKLGVKIYPDMLPSFIAGLIAAAREVEELERVKGLGEGADNKGRRV